MNSVMLDFETLGNGKNAAVIQIGACYFDPVTGAIGEKLKCTIIAETIAQYGGELDASTVMWWMQQSEEARYSILGLGGGVTDFKSAFITLNDFLGKAKHIWSHATFDFVILQETLKRLNIKPTFRYSVARDIRTLTHLCGLPKSAMPAREGTHHDALDDCLYQVKYCTLALNAIKKQKEA